MSTEDFCSSRCSCDGFSAGLSTGGLVIWINRMTDWSGRRVIERIAAELLDRLPRDAVAGPSRSDWGSTGAATVAYWKERTGAFHGSSPDPRRSTRST
jgi:hypothetical protein